MLRKRDRTHTPVEWNDEMLGELVNRAQSSQGDCNYLLLITRSQKTMEVTSSGAFEERTFIGSLASPPSSPLHRVFVQLRFLTEKQRYGRAAEIPKDAVGFLMLSEHDQIGGSPKIPTFKVVLIVDENVPPKLEKLLVETRQFGNEYLPIWVWANVQPIKGMSSREAIEFSVNSQMAINKCTVQQVLYLQGSTPQDVLLP